MKNMVTTIGSAITNQVATKSDIKDVRAEIKDLGKTMTIRLGFMFFAGFATMIAVLEVLK